MRVRLDSRVSSVHSRDLPVPRVQAPALGDVGHGLPRHEEGAEGVVPGPLPHGDEQAGAEREGASAATRPRLVPDGLDLAPEAQAVHGGPEPRPAVGRGGGGRDLRRRHRPWEARQGRGEEDRGGLRGGEGRARHGPRQARRDRGLLEGEAHGVRGRAAGA